MAVPNKTMMFTAAICVNLGFPLALTSVVPAAPEPEMITVAPAAAEPEITAPRKVVRTLPAAKRVTETEAHAVVPAAAKRRFPRMMGVYR